jgi:DUF1009 family protein
MTTLGIIAGGGDLPIAVADSARQSGREVFIVALTGCADEGVNRFAHDWSGIGEVGKPETATNNEHCEG